MKIIESFIEGKFRDDGVVEDKIIVTDHFIAMLDGATTKTCPKIAGKAGGRFAVDSAETIIRRFNSDMPPVGAVRALSDGLKKAVADNVELPPNVEHPTYSALIYSRAHREIWRVGDLHYMVDGQLHAGDKLVDTITCAARALMVDIALQRGMAKAEILQNDVGRTFIQPALNVQHFLANNADSDYGYGVIDGSNVPEKFIEIQKVPQAKEIIFASDGYPKVFGTLEESEKYLTDLLKDDPLVYKSYKATKGVAPGQASFDDRAYIRFMP